MSTNTVTERIAERLRSRGAAFTIHEHVVARTAADALERLPFSPDAYLKTVAFRLKAGGWVLAALCGADRVEYRGLAAALGVGRRDLHQLTPDEVAVDLGYPIGGVGPVPTNGETRTVFGRARGRDAQRGVLRRRPAGSHARSAARRSAGGLRRAGSADLSGQRRVATDEGRAGRGVPAL